MYCCRYPYNLDFDFGALEGLNKFSINNLGDPFIESNYGVHSREFEVRLLLRRNSRAWRLGSSALLACPSRQLQSPAVHQPQHGSQRQGKDCCSWAAPSP